MLVKKRKPPATKRRFSSPWTELDYLCKKLRFWLYDRGQPREGERYLVRLCRVLAELREHETAMLREEGLALACELQGKIGEAICHRKREISLMEKLHREALLPQYSEATRAFMLRDRDLIALKERKQIVRSLRERYTQGNGKAIDQAD